MRKRIVFYSDEPFFAGSEKRIKNLLNDKTLQKDHELIFSYRYSELYEEGLAINIDKTVKRYPVRLLRGDFLAGTKNIFTKVFIRLPLRIFKELYIYFFMDLIRIYIVIKRLKPDVVHINSGGFPTDGSCVPAAIAARLAGVEKIFFNVNNMAAPYGKYREWIERIVDRITVDSVTLFITASKAARDRLFSVRSIKKDKVVNIYTSMENDVAISAYSRDVRARFDLKPGSILIVCAAKLSKNKGHRFLIDACNLLRKENPLLYKNITVVIAGDGPERKQLECQIYDHKLIDSIYPVGFYNDIFSLINACDILVLPSVGLEDFPSSILEAMYFAKPVISTKIAGIPEQIIGGETGLLTEPASIEGLKDAMLKLANDKDLRIELGNKGKKKLFSDFPYSDFISMYSRLYE